MTERSKRCISWLHREDMQSCPSCKEAPVTMNGPWSIQWRDGGEWCGHHLGAYAYADFSDATEALRRMSLRWPNRDWRVVDADGRRIMAITNGAAARAPQ